MANLATVTVSRFRTQLGLGNQIRSLQDLERDFYSANSGLAAKFSVADHKRAFFTLKGIVGRSISDAELAYFKAQGAVGNNATDIALDFYTNHVFA